MNEKLYHFGKKKCSLKYVALNFYSGSHLQKLFSTARNSHTSTVKIQIIHTYISKAGVDIYFNDLTKIASMDVKTSNVADTCVMFLGLGIDLKGVLMIKLDLDAEHEKFEKVVDMHMQCLNEFFVLKQEIKMIKQQLKK